MDDDNISRSALNSRGTTPQEVTAEHDKTDGERSLGRQDVAEQGRDESGSRRRA